MRISRKHGSGVSAKERKLKSRFPLIQKLRERGIPETIAAYLGGGWFLLEFVHWVLIDHYELPESLFDLTLISVVCALLCSVSWRWFRAPGVARKGFRFDWILIPLFIGIALLLNGRIALDILHGVERDSYKPEWSNSIAVLPFTDLSPGKGQEYLCEGIAEDIRTKLTRLSTSLKVISRHSVIPYRYTDKTIQRIGKELGVNMLLEATVQKDNRRLRIHAKLINASDGTQVWAEKFEREFHDLFDIQDELSVSVVNSMKLKLRPDIQESIRRENPVNMDAYRFYKQANYLIQNNYANTHKEEDFNRAIQMYHEAFAVDSTFAQVHASLAWAYQHAYSISGKPDYLDRVLFHCGKAATLNPDLVQTRTAQGWLYMHHLEIDKAFESYRRAMSFDANYPTLVVAIGMSYSWVGLFKEAVPFHLKAIDLSPFYSFSWGELGYCYLYLGEHEKAEAAFSKALTLSPRSSDYLEGLVELRLKQGRLKDAEEILDRESMSGGNIRGEEVSRFRAIGYALSGEKEKALSSLRSAEVYAILGMEENAVRELHSKVQKNPNSITVSYLYLMNNPFLKTIRKNPVYQKILERQKQLMRERSREADLR